jgi:hypothetical protein
MKRVNTNKQVGLHQSLLLAGLVLASVGAQAAPFPKITMTGVVGDSLYNVDGYTGAINYDPSAILGKAFTLEMVIDADGAVKTSEEILPEFPGEFENLWAPVTVSYTLMIDGALFASGSGSQGTDINTINDITVPLGTDLVAVGAPAGIQVGHTYDQYSVRLGGKNLGCFDGGTNNGSPDGGCADSDADNVYEDVFFVPDYFWDTAIHNGLADTNLSNPADLDFTKGFGGIDFNFGHYSPDPNDEFDGNDIARIRLTSTSVTVAVPEPETWGMLLAGLGLVGFAVRRRSA